MNKSQIARVLNVHKSTITREFQRNSDKKSKGTYYFASRVERKQRKRLAFSAPNDIFAKLTRLDPNSCV